MTHTMTFNTVKYTRDDELTKEFHDIMRRGDPSELGAWLVLHGGDIVITSTDLEGNVAFNTAFFFCLAFTRMLNKKVDGVKQYRVEVKDEPTNSVRQYDNKGNLIKEDPWNGWQDDVVMTRVED